MPALSPGIGFLDLGCGAGVDVFRSAKLVGGNGFVTGVDMTPEMITQARKNAFKGGFRNVDFKLGEVEDLPVGDESYNVVISNCVINLVPDKKLAFQEIYRVLKPGGHFCISDIVTNGEIPDTVRADLDAWAACVSGALDKKEYLGLLTEAGFTSVKVIQTNIYGQNLNDQFELESVTVVGYKN